MKIVFMNGGLGNQMFQYIFLRWLEAMTGDTCIVDDSPFFGSEVPHNGYELTRIFGVQPKRLSTCFDADVWEYMVRQRVGVAGVAQQLKDAGMDFSFIYEGPTFHYDGKAVPADKNPGRSVQVPGGDTYYHGYWIGTMYFLAVEQQIRQEMIFPVLRGERNLDYQALIRRSKAVAVHIRRGDMAAFGGCSEPGHFARGIAWMEQQMPGAQYFLFSDDPEWCHAHWQELGLKQVEDRVTCIEGNRGADAYMDMQLMSLCGSFICDRSTFSFMAHLLSACPHQRFYSGWGRI